jgi:hypothetical protein
MASRTTVARKTAKRKKANTRKRPGPVVNRVPEQTVDTARAPVAERLGAGTDSVDKLAAWLLQQADLSGV